jgi:copper(I)-binding protein
MRHTRTVRACLAIFAVVTLGDSWAGQTGHDAPTIQLENAWARRAPMMAPEGQGTPHQGPTMTGNGAIYVTIRNHGSEPDALVSATSGAATTVELHETVEVGGTMMMRPLPKIDMPAGATLEMKPGGYHVMLLGLTRDLKPGDAVAVTLTFERAGQTSVEAPVK